MTTPTFVLPGDVDDPAAASGGNVYGRLMCEHLGARKIAVPGAWPLGDPDLLDRSLRALPDGTAVIVDGLVGCAWPEIIGPAARRLRLAVLVHLPLGDERGLERGLAANLDARERATLHAVQAVIATSPWSARRLVTHHDLDPRRVRVVAPGTAPAALAAGTDGRSRLLCVAALTPHKGQDLLVEALARVADLPWTCVLAGPVGRDPEFVVKVLGLIERHRLADRITVAGSLPPDRLDEVYGSADLVVHPSHCETYGMVVAEALARGIPVLAASVGAIPDTLGREPEGDVPGILVAERVPWAFAEALRRWLTEPGLPDELRARARRRRPTLAGWPDAARELAAVLANLEPAWAA